MLLGTDAIDAYFSIPKDRVVGLDIETYARPEFKAHKNSGLDPHLSLIRLIQFYTPSTGALIIDLLEHPNFVLREDLIYVGHNFLFELKHLQHTFNVKFESSIHCTMLMDQLIVPAMVTPYTPDYDELDDSDLDGTAKYKQDGYSLAASYYRHFKKHVSKEMQNSDWSQLVLTTEQYEYAAFDAVAAYELAIRQIQILKKLNLYNIYKLQRDMLFVVAEMELTGVAVDWEKHKILCNKWQTELDSLTTMARQLFGAININSSTQLGEWLRKNRPELVDEWPKTPKGALQFSSKALPDYAETYKEFGVLLRQKKLQKMVTAFGDSLLKHKSPATGRVHPSYRLGSTHTGRMSCSNPNFQQCPRDPEFRQLFIVADGMKMVAGDFAQIEVQVQGQLSCDPVMLKNYENGDDIYITLAKEVFKTVEVTKQQRQVAKQLVLSLGFGMGAKKFKMYCHQAGVELTTEEASQYHRLYHDTFKVYSTWCNEVRLKAELTGEAVTVTGKRRKIAADEVYTKAPNLCVQGSACELLQMTMVELRKKYHGKVKIIAAVHDEILLECPDKLVEPCKKLFEQTARNVFKTMFTYPSKNILDANIGNNWAEVK